MKRTFMRAFWGVYEKGNRITERKERVERNIVTLLKNKYNEPFRKICDMHQNLLLSSYITKIVSIELTVLWQFVLFYDYQ